MGRPTIDIIFKQVAVTAINRSGKGVICLIIKDDTDKTFSTVEYKSATDIDIKKFTAKNIQYITDCFTFNPAKVIVIRLDVAGLIANALTIASGLKFNYIGLAEGVQADQQALATWIKTQEALKKTYKAVTFNATTTDSKRIINLVNSKVTFKDARGEQTGEKYVASMLGILAGLPLDRSCTYFKCTNLTSVVEPADIDVTIDGGNMVLINEDGFVKIGAGVNSLTTVTADNTEDMKQIAVIEAMDLIMEDIRNTFKDFYIGKYKNKYDNQALFISAINSYFKTLEQEDVLDNAYKNTAKVDIATQKLAWDKIGKDTSGWTEQDIKNNAFRNNIFLNADIKILGAIENLKLNISMV